MTSIFVTRCWTPAEAALLPGPELRGDEPDDRDIEALQVFSETEVNVGEVNKDRHAWTYFLNVTDELLELGVDVGSVADDLGDAHVGDVFGADDALLPGALHLLPAESGEGGGGECFAESVDDLGAVVIARCLAGGEEEVRVGRGGDGASLSRRPTCVRESPETRWRASGVGRSFDGVRLTPDFAQDDQVQVSQ